MNYIGLNTKIKAMRANLLNKSDYINLSKSKNVQEVVKKLKKFHAYKKFLESIKPEKLHRGYIESKLILSGISDFKRIYNFISDYKLKKYLSAFFLRNEIYILKLILSMIYDKRDINYDLSEIINIFGVKSLKKINLTKLPSSVKEFINSLNNTDCYDLLNNAYSKSKSLFDLQMQLDIYYYTHLWNLQKKYLSGEDLDVLKKITGIEMDLINIIWLYRIKKYYKLDNNILSFYIVPIKYKLSSNEVKKLINSNTIDEFKKIVNNSYYGSIFKFSDYNLESVFYKILSRLYYKFYLRSQKNITNIVYYIYLKEHEVNNITSLLEGVRYGLEYDKIISRLNLQEVHEN